MRFVAKILVICVCLFAGALRADAAPILGVAVQSLTSTTQVGLSPVYHDPTPDGSNNGSGGWIPYYIPLKSSTSGTYGVTDTNGSSPGGLAGTYADSGSGNSSLKMFLMFTPVNTVNLKDARLDFLFSDLDLRYVNDPQNFLETVRIYSAKGTAISQQFTAASSDMSGTFSGINYLLDRKSGSAGASWPVNLSLWGDGLEALITNPFWVQLNFTIPSVPYGTNTPEYLRATLTTTNGPATPPPPVVPEPASLVLLATGLVVSARSLRRKRAAQAK